MRMVDVIIKKRNGLELSEEEIRFFVEGFTSGEIPSYQASSLAMAILFKGMNKKEIGILTDAMLHSGETIDLSSIEGIKVDKHSTGGVGDKTSLVLGPLVAACGVKLAKMSGRGLGHTGGTLDKLESIPGCKIGLSREEFINQVNKYGLAIVGQTGNLVPADKKLYALRDVTGTVESIPLIASSIMSKKLASGSDTILLDVKFGSGAFMKDIDQARLLARTMVDIGDHLHRDTRAILTDMDQPLGLAIGNSLEVIEAINTLNGKGPSDLVELCLGAGAIMLMQAKKTSSIEEGRKLLQEKIDNKEALEKLCDLVRAQGGDESYIRDPSKFEKAKYIIAIKAENEGYVKQINALEIGDSAMRLGAGRATYDDVIDPSSGIVLSKKVGDKVNVGDVLCTVYTNKEDNASILKDIHDSFKLSSDIVKINPIIYEVIK
ncbi:MAG: pyrimidine-nucleoside phosphorylase [Bacilli bacterium]|nr:pyrimidine-nucleoside phosphorylase [Erysipelotrichaceae bacterium]MDD7382339.1 pyrimidine-nucleoside phosphorylase [Bacillales bacterium]MDY2746669.1 pyrimidine-nucleoside phosphorylase [Bacilli bacterium]MDY3889866.1 pyrimidine-nucleoside phosphorylase [Bacilli bacterium]